MQYQLLGKSDLNVSRIGMGCMSLPADEKLAIPVIHHALMWGVNFFDTADIYNDGVNEIIVGKALKERRKDVIIASKAGNVRRKDGGLDWNPSRQHILESIEGSLRRLGTDYIDLYQLHGGTIGDNIDETIGTFEMLKQQGKIRHYGISSIRPNVISEYIKRSAITSIMMQYSLLDRRPEETCLDLIRENHIGVLVRGAIAQGLLSGKPAKSYLEHSPEQVQKAADAIRKNSRERTAAQTAIKYVLQNPAVTSVVVGTRTSEQLVEAVTALDAADLTAEELSDIERSAPALVYKEHRAATMAENKVN